MQHAYTCFAPAKARLVPAKSWKDVLDSQNNRQNECLGVAFVIKFASSDIDRPDSGTSPVEGYVHDDSDAGCQLTIQISLNFFRPLLQIPPGDVVGKTSKWKCLFTPNEGKLFYEGR